MTKESLLGYPLSQALEALASAGERAPQVLYTEAPPRRGISENARAELTSRVVGVRENALIAARFRDTPPGDKPRVRLGSERNEEA